jgi:hypothetical protein
MDVAVPVVSCVPRAPRALTYQPKTLRLMRVDTRNVAHQTLEVQIVLTSHKLEDLTELRVDPSLNLSLDDHHNLILHSETGRQTLI